MTLRLLAAALFATAAVAAQQAPVWKLPKHGAAEYRRTYSAVSDVAAKAAEAPALDAKGKVPDELLPDLLPAPWICQGELTDDQLAIGDKPRDLRDVLRLVASDLRLAGAVKLRAHRIVPFGDLVVTGKAEPMAADGAQSLTFAVATEDPEVLPGESKATMAKFVRDLCKHQAKGELRLRRTFDAQRGAVGSWQGELSLVYEESKGAWRKLVVRDAWDLVAVHDNQDAAFRGAVAQAIREGAKWLRRDLEKLDRSHLLDRDDKSNTYGAGRIALALLTLLHAETPVNDPVVAAGFAELRKRVLVDTYSLAVALMALAERYTPPGEADLLRSGTLAAPKPRVLSAEDKKIAAEWLAALLQNIDTRHKPDRRLAFNYTAGPRFDNSLTQYGLLGLYAALLCDLDVPKTAWAAAAEHQLLQQCDHFGRAAVPQLVRYADRAAQARGELQKQKPSTGTPAPVRGYCYREPTRPAYGSMTAAGVGSLLISRFGLLYTGQAKSDALPKIDAGIQSGFAWLGEEFSVRSNPGFVEKGDDSYYYYLYGLERTCELAGVALLHDRDWYYEGAVHLLALQNRNGSWPVERRGRLMIDATCFAVLFLKKAALPPTTGG
ncbi:MAG: hypothetical protein FJ301_07075 [Planctomycetes bacterium]|nr:hypothetical protein [Planctomycetota bacterium]